ncbi:hypothetical protein KY289_026744 [Solanum tuberosum]|nr:hypothetical protein KY289_026744 [Solanum tuberosum]
MRDGPVLTRTQQLALIQPFTIEDVLTTLKGIDDNKAPKGDGFNEHFFKQAWTTIGDATAFVPGRMLNDNVILSHELVKGYYSCFGFRVVKITIPACPVSVSLLKKDDLFACLS